MDLSSRHAGDIVVNCQQQIASRRITEGRQYGDVQVKNM
jgi:hypothetical protein